MGKVLITACIMILFASCKTVNTAVNLKHSKTGFYLVTKKSTYKGKPIMRLKGRNYWFAVNDTVQVGQFISVTFIKKYKP